jgi:hypothetical protein
LPVRATQHPGLWIGRLEVECAVWPVTVVVAGEDAEHALEVTLVHDQEPIETLGTDGADKHDPKRAGDRAVSAQYGSAFSCAATRIRCWVIFSTASLNQPG